MRARTTQREREADLGTFVHPHAANSSSYSLVNYVFIDDSEDATLEANVVESGREGERERENHVRLHAIGCYRFLLPRKLHNLGTAD